MALIRMKEYRERENISMNQLAKKAGISQSLVCDIENGKVKNPGVRTMKRIADALNCSLDDLVTEDGE